MDRNESNKAVLDEPLTVSLADLSLTDDGNRSIERSKKSLKKSHSHPMLVKLAKSMLNLNKSSNKKKVKSNGTSVWEKFVSSMRPLHSHAHGSPPPPITGPLSAPGSPAPNILVPESGDNYSEVFMSPMSPSQASSSSGMRSNYSSAVNLQELDDDQGNDFNGGDEMIDVKAELFISQFYEQMKLQSTETDDKE